MSDRFFFRRFQFTESMEAMEAKAEVLMGDAIDAMNEIARSLTEYDEPPIPMAERRAACIKLCAETFDRLELICPVAKVSEKGTQRPAQGRGCRGS